MLNSRAFAEKWLLYRNDLIWTWNHGNEYVEENNDVDEAVWAEHKEGPEPCETLDSRQLKDFQLHQSETCPEEWLWRLEQTRSIGILVSTNIPVIFSRDIDK